MEFIIRISVFSLYILFLLGICEAYKQCKVPNGGAGTCIQITKCQPLNELYKKKPKTEKEHLYIQQSMCGQGVKIKVCCPSQSDWSRFQPNPIIFPDSKPIFTHKPNEVDSTPTGKPTVVNPLPLTLINVEPPINVTNEIPKPAYELGERRLPFELPRSCGVDSSSSNKIFGGGPTAIDAYPWLAILEYAGQFLGCGGSLITPRFVLTAAHCLKGSNGQPLRIRLSEYNLTSYPTDEVEVDGGGIDTINNTIVPVDQIYLHPNYSRTQKIHDIGLIRLKYSVKLTEFIKTICLPPVNYMSEFSKSTNFTLAGWGQNEQFARNEVKVDVVVPFMPSDECDQFHNTIDSQICAGGEEGKDSCSGDSGGPLMYEKNQLYYAVGVVSYGRQICATKGVPAVYTNVYMYLSWIHQILINN